MKTTSNGRQHQNIKSWISKQPLIGSSLNFKLKQRGTNQNNKFPPMEDDLKQLKVEYLSNHWSDLHQISNLSLGDHIKLKNSWNEENYFFTTDTLLLILYFAKSCIQCKYILLLYFCVDMGIKCVYFWVFLYWCLSSFGI